MKRCEVLVLTQRRQRMQLNSDGHVRSVSKAGNRIVTAPAPFRSIRGVRISTYATGGLRETANADSSIDDRKQQHMHPKWSASQTRIMALIAAAANV